MKNKLDTQQIGDNYKNTIFSFLSSTRRQIYASFTLVKLFTKQVKKNLFNNKR